MNGDELTTDTMRAHHRIMRSEHDPENWDRPNIEEEADDEFDRWLNKVKEEVWDECNDEVAKWAGAMLPDDYNPYREEES